MSNSAWLFVAYVIVFSTIGGYVAYLSTRRKQLQRRLDELKAR